VTHITLPPIYPLLSINITFAHSHHKFTLLYSSPFRYTFGAHVQLCPITGNPASTAGYFFTWSCQGYLESKPSRQIFLMLDVWWYNIALYGSDLRLLVEYMQSL
jgi:hypothetical protein